MRNILAGVWSKLISPVLTRGLVLNFWVHVYDFLDKRSLRLGGLTALYNSLKGGCGEVEVSLFCHLSSKKVRGNGLKFHQGKFRLDVRNKFLTEVEMSGQTFEHWYKLSREMMESPALEGV